jgi:hypothetical protein
LGEVVKQKTEDLLGAAPLPLDVGEAAGLGILDLSLQDMDEVAWEDILQDCFV